MSFSKDRNGVVWFDGGLMAAEVYAEMQQENSDLLPYDELPFFDVDLQNVVDTRD